MATTTEQIYDEQIAPLMTKIIEVCKEHRIPFVAQAELHDAEGPVYSRTSLFTDSAAMRMLHYLMLSGNNLDLFLITCRKDEKLMDGNTSAFMHILSNAAEDERATNPRRAR